MMKLIIQLALFLITGFFAFGQNSNQAIQQKWQSNFVIGSDDYSALAQQKTIKLERKEENVYGTFLELKTDGTFTSYNQGPCGNECRVRTNGNYVIDSLNSTISFTLTEITYWKMCYELNNKKREVPELLGKFKLNPIGNGFELSRLEDIK